MEEFFENELASKFEEMIENGDEYYFDSEELERLIIFYLELGDVNYAELAVEHGLKIHPNSIEIKTKKLEVLLELENYFEAKKLIDELQASSLEDTDFLVCCAKYYSNLGNPKKTIDYCKLALQLKEEENFLHNFIADEYINIDDPFSALNHYKKALLKDPQDDYSLENVMSCYQMLQKKSEAIDFLNDYLDRYSFSETAWLEYGQFYFNQKNYEEAIKGFDYLLAINSSSIGVYSHKAASFEALKLWDKAIEVYEEMLELEYTKAYTLYKIGLCYRELKRPIQAINAFQRSLLEDPQFYLSMMEESYIYEELGATKEALHYAKEATALNEDNLDYQKRLAFLNIEAVHLEEGLHSLKKLIKEEPSRFYNWYACIEVMMLLGENEEAIATVKEAIKIHPRAELFYQLSNCYFLVKNKEAARKALNEALAKDANLLKDMQLKYPSLRDNSKSSKAKKK